MRILLVHLVVSWSDEERIEKAKSLDSAQLPSHWPQKRGFKMVCMPESLALGEYLHIWSVIPIFYFGQLENEEGATTPDWMAVCHARKVEST